jgi:hypothetical protein
LVDRVPDSFRPDQTRAAASRREDPSSSITLHAPSAKASRVVVEPKPPCSISHFLSQGTIACSVPSSPSPRASQQPAHLPAAPRFSRPPICKREAKLLLTKGQRGNDQTKSFSCPARAHRPRPNTKDSSAHSSSHHLSLSLFLSALHGLLLLRAACPAAVSVLGPAADARTYYRSQLGRVQQLSIRLCPFSFVSA